MRRVLRGSGARLRLSTMWSCRCAAACGLSSTECCEKRRKPRRVVPLVFPFRAVTVAAAGADQGGLGNVEATARRDLDAGSGKLVPAAELGQGDTEAVCDGDQGVAAAGGVVDGVRRWRSGRSDGHDERFDAIELACLAQADWPLRAAETETLIGVSD